MMLTEIKLQCSSLAKAHPGSNNLFKWSYVFVKFAKVRYFSHHLLTGGFSFFLT